MSLTTPDVMQTSPYGTLGAGVPLTVDGELDDFNNVPYTGTPPYGEPPLETGYEEDSSTPMVAPVDPRFNTEAEAIMLHDQIHGTPWRGYSKGVVVNPSNPGIPNLGPVEVAEGGFQSGHSQALIHNPSAEQGWGLDPAILRSRFPASENVNPYYAKWTHRRNGQFDWTPEDMPFGDLTQQNVEMQWQRRRLGNSRLHKRLLANPQPMSYSDTVPVGGQAGPLNLIPDTEEAIY